MVLSRPCEEETEPLDSRNQIVSERGRRGWLAMRRGMEKEVG